MARALTVLAALLAGSMLVAAKPAAAEDFGLNPGTFIAKTHPHVGLEEFGDPPETIFTRQINLAGYTDDEGTYHPGIVELDPVTEAGAHPDATTHFALRTAHSSDGELRPEGRPNEYARDVVVDLPSGFLGNPQVAATCPADLLQSFWVGELPPGVEEREICPASSQVGVVTVNIQGGAPLDRQTLPLYNLVPPAGAPAAFGFTVGAIAPQPIILIPELRSEGDYGIQIESPNISGLPFPPRSVTVTLWGVPAHPRHDPDRFNPDTFDWGASAGIQRRPFTINPPRCNTGELATEISMRSWQQPGRWLPRDLSDPAEADEYRALSPEPTNCEALPEFEPELDMRPAVRAAGSPASYETNLSMDYNDDPDGRAGAHVKRVEVELPEGVSVNPSSAHGLEACTDSQAGFGTRSVANCPAASRIGQVAVDTPLLPEPLRGHAYLGSPTPDQLLRTFIILEGFGMVVRVAGDVHTDPETGQMTAVFDENPQVPFENLRVRFDGGPRAALVNPPKCGRYETVTRITSWNDDVHVSRSGFNVTSGPGAGCPASLPFNPFLQAGTVNPASGHHTTLITRFGRTDREQEISSIELDMPQGLVAKIAGVPLCSDAAADRGTCGPGSRIGHVQIASGAGTQPYWVPGPGKDRTSVFLAGPYRGAPYSLSIVAPAQAGPFDLGRVVVRAPIEVDDRTTELSIGIAESRVFNRFGSLERVIPGEMPTVLEGIPLKVKDVRVIVDRDEFILNPTNCHPKQIRGLIGSAEGASSEVLQRFQAADCAELDFAPRFGMRIMNPGRRSTLRSFNPRMRFSVAPREGHANIGRAAVTLPRSIILDQSNIRTVCTRPEFAARNCPDAAIYGFARAWSPLLDEPLVGPVYLGSSPNPLPDLIADLQGDVRVILQGQIVGTRDGRMRNIFPSIPDVPVEFFQLEMFGGQNRGVLVNSTDLCRSPNRGVANFHGQNAKRDVSRPRVGLSFRGCRQIRQRIAQRHAKRRAALRQAVRQGRITPAQARRAIRR